ncbi:magnesium transporter CorA family protein [Lactococcus garvieae]|uniref:magnesium transporter CorA family protein n=1 Tax=Lactococcus garvieae TaxID=1363 RepID=UPI00288DDA13|nr:magnesium transporter CorA family protein [Lactococcus garvieae]MDT2742551.1 magnesium transporter CorA family protein [Lactococcus garvieae]
MFKYKVLKACEAAASKIVPLGSEEENTIFYFYQPDRQFFKLLNNQFQQNLSSLYYDKKEANYFFNKGENENGSITLLLLYPREREEAEFKHMVDSLLILQRENSVIIITEDKEDFVLEFLKDCQKEFKNEEILVNLINAALAKMTEDAQKIRDEIIKLETSINENGPTRSLFTQLLQLKKYLISLSLTYDSDDKIIEFFKREKNALNLDENGHSGIIKLEENLDSLKKLTQAYNKYLASLDTMVNNLSAFRLNTIMKTLTEISIVLTIPTMIYGFWGINLKLPFEEFSFGFLLVLAISLALSGAVWYWMRKIKLL